MNELPELTPTQRKLAAAILRETAELCANRVCDEIDLSQILDTPQERQTVIQSALTFSGEIDEYEISPDYKYVSISDYRLAEWLASLLYPYSGD